MEQPKKDLYKKLSADGAYTKSYEEFEQQFNSPEKQEALYQKLNADGKYTKSKDEFVSRFFSEKKKDGSNAPSSSSTTQKPIPDSETQTKSGSSGTLKMRDLKQGEKIYTEKNIPSETTIPKIPALPKNLENVITNPVNVAKAQAKQEEEKAKKLEVANKAYDYALNNIDTSVSEKRYNDEVDNYQFLDGVKQGLKNLYNAAVVGPANAVNNLLGTKPLEEIGQYRPLEKELKEAKKQLQEELGPKATITNEQIQKKAKDIFIQNDVQEQMHAKIDEALPSDYDREGVWKELKLKELNSNALLKSKVVSAEVFKSQLEEFQNFAKSMDGKTPTEQDVLKYNQLKEKATFAVDGLNYLAKNFDNYLKEAKTDGEKLELFKYNYDDYEKNAKLLWGSVMNIAGGSVKLAAETSKFVENELGLPSIGTESASALGSEVMNDAKKMTDPFYRYKATKLNSWSDLGSYASQLASEQIPILASIYLGGTGGVAVVSMSSGGQKINDLEEQAKQPFGRIYSDGEKLTAGWLYAGAEFIPEKLGTARILKDMERTISSASSASRRLFRDNFMKETVKGLGKFGYYSGLEGGTEYLTAEAQIGIDRELLDIVKTDFENNEQRAESFFAGAGMGGGMAVAGGALGFAASQAKLYSDQKDIKKVQDILANVDIINSEIENNKTLSESEKKELYSKMNEMNNQAFSIVEKNAMKGANLSVREKSFLLDVNENQSSIREKAEEIKNSNYSREVKKAMLNDLKKEFETLEENRNKTLNGEYNASMDSSIKTKPKQNEQVKIPITETEQTSQSQAEIKTEVNEVSNTISELEKQRDAEIEALKSKRQYDEKNITPIREKYDALIVKEKAKETEAKIKRKDLFQDGGTFSNQLGESGVDSVPTNHQEINGIEFVEFSNPNTGVVDVIMSGTSDSDFVGYYRVYENGKPTEKWSSKFENQSRNKENFKTMISGVQSMLPKGHLYTEKTSISTDGLRVWEQQLSRGYEIQTDSNGNIITNEVAINGDAINNELGIDVNQGNFDNISVTNNQQFETVKKALLPYLKKLGLNESNIKWENGTVFIDLPVLKQKTNNETASPSNIEPNGNVRPRVEPMEQVGKNKQPTAEIVAKESIQSANDVKPIEGESKITKEPTLEDISNFLNENFKPNEANKGTKETSSKKEEETKQAKGFISIALDKLTTSLKDFQGRGVEYSKQTYDRIVNEAKEGILNISAIPPVQIWKDPKTGEFVILAGHSRTKAFSDLANGEIQYDSKYKKSDFTNINAQIVEAETLQEAQKIAQESNQGAVQTVVDNAKYVRENLLPTFNNFNQAKTKLKSLYGSAWARIYAYANLNPKGKAMQMLKQFQEANESDSNDKSKKIAEWTGKARQEFSNLTDAHENEIFDYLSKNDKIKTYTELGELLNRRVNGLEEFNVNEPLNFEQKVGRGSNEVEIVKQIQDLKNRDAEIKKKIRELQSFGKNINDIQKKQIKDLTAESIKINTVDIPNAQIKQKQARVADAEQFDIFSQINEQIENGNITPEQVDEFVNDDRKAEEIEPIVEAIEVKAKSDKKVELEEVVNNVENQIEREPADRGNDGGVQKYSGKPLVQQENKRPGIVVQAESKMPPTNNFVSKNYEIDEVQKQGVNSALSLFENGGKSFLLADGTGVGKTRQILVIAKEYLNKFGGKVLIISENTTILTKNFANDAKALGIDMNEFEFGTYNDLRTGKKGKDNYGLVIYDEAHNLKNQESGKAIAAGNIKSKNNMYVTATPMDTIGSAVYFISEVSGVTEEQAYNMLGLNVKKQKDTITGQEVKIVTLQEGVSPADIKRNIVKIREEIISKGAMLRREYPFYGEFVEDKISLTEEQSNEQDEIESNWDDRIEYESMTDDGRVNFRKKMNLSGQKSGELSRWSESTKIKYTFKEVVKAIKEGKKVVVIAEGVNETTITAIDKVVPGFLSELSKMLKAEGYKVAEIFGKSDKGEANDKFQANEVDVVLGTAKSASTGIDLDDQNGDSPRVLFMVTPNYSGNVFQQILGRVSRRNTKSPAQIRLLFNESNIDARRKQIVNGKLQTLKAIQEGIIDDEIEIDIQETPTPSVDVVIDLEGITLENISEKAFVVKGDTRPIKDNIKAIGGKYNPKYGWMFPISRKAEVQEMLNKISNKKPVISESQQLKDKLNAEVDTDLVSKEYYDKFQKDFPNTLLAIEEKNGLITIFENGETREIQDYEFVKELKNALAKGYKGIGKVTRKVVDTETKKLRANAEVDKIADKIKDFLPGIKDPDVKAQGLSQDAIIDLIASAVKNLINSGIEIDEAIKQVVSSLKERFGDLGFDIDPNKVKAIVNPAPNDFTREEGKKSLLSRISTGSDATLKKAISKYSLDYDIENQETAKNNADKFVEDVGIEQALLAVRTNQIVGAEKAFVYNKIIQDISNNISKVSEQEAIELERINVEILGEIANEFDQESRNAGRFISALQKVYSGSQGRYNLSLQIQQYKSRNDGTIPDEILAKFKEANEKILELEKRLEEAEKTRKEQSTERSIEEMIDAIARKSKIDKSKGISDKSKAKAFADKLRSYKLKTDGLRSTYGADVIYNNAIELVAKTIETGGKISDAIKQGVKYIREQEVEQEVQDKAISHLFNAFDQIESQNKGIRIDDAGKLKIPHSIIREKVEGGIDNVEDLVKSVQEDLSEIYPDQEFSEREIRDAITDYGKISNPTKDDIEIEISVMKSLGKLISGLEDAYSGKRPLRSGLQRRKPTLEERSMTRKLKELLRDLPMDDADLARSWKTALDAIKTRLSNEIADLDKQLELGEKRKPERKTIEYDQEAKDLKSIRDQKKQTLDELVGKPELSEEEKIDKAIILTQKSIDALQEMIVTGEIAYKKRPEQVTSEKLQAMRDHKKSLQKQIEDMRQEAGLAEQKRLEIAKKTRLTRIEELKRRIREKDYSVRTQKPLPIDEELLDIEMQLQEQKAIYEKEKHIQELKDRSIFRKWMSNFVQFLGITRLFKAGGEFSQVLVQQGFVTPEFVVKAPLEFYRAYKSEASAKKALMNVTFMRAMYRLGKAFVSPDSSKRYEAEMKSHPLYPLMQKAKLTLTGTDHKLDAQEENYQLDLVTDTWNYIGDFIDRKTSKRDFPTLSGLIKKIIGSELTESDRKSLGTQFKEASLWKMFERGAVTYSNYTKIIKFEQGVKELQKDLKDPINNIEDYKKVANYINVFSGRANLGKAEMISKDASLFVFSLRNAVSQFQQLNPLYYLGTLGDLGQIKKVKDFKDVTKLRPTVAQKMAVKSFMTSATSIIAFKLAFMAWANAGEDDEEKKWKLETDPRSSDFGKLRKGKTTFDLWHGLNGLFVLYARIFWYHQSIKSGEIKELGKGFGTPTHTDLVINYATNKLSPTMGYIWRLGHTHQEIDPNTGEEYRVDKYGNVYGEKEMRDLFIPIYWNAFNEIQKEDPDIYQNFLLSLGLLGMSVGTDPKGEKFKDIVGGDSGKVSTPRPPTPPKPQGF